MAEKLSAAIVGSGNIGTDLLIKLLKSDHLDVHSFIGIDPASEGLRIAKELGVRTSAEGVDWLLDQAQLPDIVFEATSATTHATNAPRYRGAEIIAIDLTPAAVGPSHCPATQNEFAFDIDNLNMITCGGQATIPIVHAVSSVARVPYAEIVASIASRSAGPGTRANIDEFTETTARALESVGGAEEGKAIIILNPAEPPLVMRDTVFCAIEPGADRAAISASIVRTVERVQQYVPGYRMRQEPQFDEPDPLWGNLGRVTVLLEVEGNGDFLPPWAGNLDIMTAAALAAGESIAQRQEASL